LKPHRINYRGFSYPSGVIRRKDNHFGEATGLAKVLPLQSSTPKIKIWRKKRGKSGSGGGEKKDSAGRRWGEKKPPGVLASKAVSPCSKRSRGMTPEAATRDDIRRTAAQTDQRTRLFCYSVYGVGKKVFERI